MLVLSRQRDETIIIGDDIEVSVVDIRGDKVRLGINAPREISVHRKEIYDAIRRENPAAGKAVPPAPAATPAVAVTVAVAAPPPAPRQTIRPRDPYVPGRGCAAKHKR